MDINSPIGVFDSGIGGLSVLKQFIRFLPFEKYIYLGDKARVPYGNKSKETVIKYSLECTEFLLKQDVKLIIVACNTASSIALEELRKLTEIPIIGMIYPAVMSALRETTNNKIGVIGTRATINSKSHSKAFKELSNEKIDIYTKACPLFVPIVEEGWEKHPATNLIVQEYLKELKDKSIDTLVLGCTHYPLLKEAIADFLPGIKLIDSGEHAAVYALRILAEKKLLIKEKKEFIKKPEINFFVTGLPDNFEEIAKRFLGFDIQKPIKVNYDWTY